MQAAPKASAMEKANCRGDLYLQVSGLGLIVYGGD